MKTTTLLIWMTIIAVFMTPELKAQDDSTGLPGDHFSLEGALEAFRQAGTVEGFEKMLNLENNHINNLDLNNDGQVDYIKVLEKMENNSHIFVLQDQVLELENQDIAVLELEKTNDTSAVLQIVGDPDIYGEEVILEASGSLEGSGLELEKNLELEKGLEKNNGGPNYSYENSIWNDPPDMVINVWTWPLVRFVYAPVHTVWVSTWTWKAHPLWWHPWHPVAWRVFHPFGARFRHRCVIAHTHRAIYAHKIYGPRRSTSVFVRTRHGAVITRYRTNRVGGPGPGKVRVIRVRGRH